MKVCIGGGATDADGVCIEHGETACVITLSESRRPVDDAAIVDAPMTAETSGAA
jgi:hypothetical protein